MIFLLIFLILFCVVWVGIRLIYIPRPSSHTLYFGAVGSGKTMFLTKLAVKYCNKYTIFSNYPIAYPNVYKFNKSMLGVYEFPKNSILLFDECSLNGFDNREFKNNFKGNNSLEYFKLIRHFRNCIVWSNQGWDEADKKIKTLCNTLYIVKKLPLISVATRIYMDSKIDQISGVPADKYRYPSVLRLIFDPNCIHLVFRRKYGQYYNSWSVPQYKKFIPEPYISNPPDDDVSPSGDIVSSGAER